MQVVVVDVAKVSQFKTSNVMYKASLDKNARLIPYVMAAFAIALLIVGFVNKSEMAPLVLSVPSAFILVLILGCRAYMPLGYTIDAGHINVERKMGQFSISRAEIEKISIVNDSELGRTWRMMGNGGIFGYTGWFSSANYGKMRWFVTSREKYILIQMYSGKKYLLSPDDCTGFMKEAKG